MAFLTEYAIVDRIIRHLALTFVAEKPPPAHVFEQVEKGNSYPTAFPAANRRLTRCRVWKYHKPMLARANHEADGGNPAPGGMIFSQIKAAQWVE